MGLFGNKTKGDASVLKDSEIIAENVKQLRVVAVKFSECKECASKVTALAETYQYVSPKENKDTIAKDKKIADRIGDLQVAVTKVLKTKQCDEVDDIVQKIKVLIAER